MAGAHGALSAGNGNGYTLLGVPVGFQNKITFARYREYPRDIGDNAVVQNYGLCDLCLNPYLLDASGSATCSRKMCKAVLVVRQQEREAKEAADHLAWVNKKYRRTT